MIKEISPNQALSSLKLYFKWRVKRAAKLVALAKKYCQLNDKNILEVGCGFGPIAANLSPKKSKIYSIDPSIESLTLFKKFNHDKKINIKVAGNEKLPFLKSFFDIIFSFDSFEHVQNPSKSMKENFRVLKKNGFLLIEATPYFSLIAGHHLYNFTLLPAQFLPRSFIKWIIFKKKGYPIRSPQSAWETFTGLNKISIAKIKKLAIINQFKIVEENYIVKIPKLFEVKINWIKHIPIIREIVTMSYQIILQKS